MKKAAYVVALAVLLGCAFSTSKAQLAVRTEGASNKYKHLQANVKFDTTITAKNFVGLLINKAAVSDSIIVLKGVLVKDTVAIIILGASASTSPVRIDYGVKVDSLI